MKRYLLDANVILRFLRNDDPKLSPLATALFSEMHRKQCVLVLPQVILAECVYVMSSFYKTEREAIANALIGIISQAGVQMDERAVALEALKQFAATKIDYADCYLAARARFHNEGVATFDRDVRKFDDVQIWEPAAGDEA